ncbi:unnamed protein product [Leuciscus chuanchicus]
MVTVSSAQPSAPKSIFALSQCSAGSDGFLTVGCLTKGFSPADSLTFRWKAPGGKDLNTFVQYPAFGRDGDYTKISHMRVKKSDWNPENPYTCEASNSKGTLSTKVAPPAPPPDQPATVVLTVPTIKELESGTATFSCSARQFSPKKYSFKWFQDDKEVTNAITHDTSEKKASVTLYSATSIFQISVYKWTNTDVKVKCEFVHKTGKEVREAQYTAKFTLTLKPPIERELFVHDKVVLEAVVSGDVHETVQEASVSCTVKNGPVPIKNIKPGNVFTDTSLFMKIHKVTIDKETWFDGEIVTCTIRDTNNNREIKQEIHFDKGDGQIPNVTIHRPDLINNDSVSVSLVCEVTSHKLGDVYIMWKVNGNPYREAITSSPNCKMDTKSVLSILTVSQKEYEDPQTTITCAVKHANMENTSVPLQVTTSKAKFTLTLKPPIERELFVHDKVVLEAVVSGDVHETVQEASVSCTVKNGPVPIKNIKPGNVFTDTSLFMKIHKVTIDKETWFDGEIVTCTIRDTNNNREIKQEIHFDKGDGQIPTVTIHRPDLYNDSVSLVCEVTSHKLGDVYIMWQVNGNPYIEAITSSPNCKMDAKSVLSILTVSQKEYEDPQTTITCAVKHANMKDTSVPLQVTTSKAKFTLTLKPPIERELFVHDKVVLEAVVSGDVQETVQEASVSCTVKNEPVSSENIKPRNVFNDTSLFKRIHNVTINTTTWFDGEIVTCTIRDTNNNREIKQEIHFDKGDGQIPTVTIHRPDLYNDSVSLVCEVTSHKLGDVYIMWKVNGNPYREAKTSSPNCNMDTKSVLSILTVSQKEYEDPQTTITCAVKHANMENTSVPLQVTTSKAKFTLTLKPPIERELFVHNKVVLEAVVSGDVQKTVQEASVSCTVKNEPVSSENIKPGNVFKDTSLFKRIHYVTINTTTWFDGEIVTCTIRDTNNNREIKQEIHFDKGDGQIPTVTIHRPDLYNDSVSLVCEVTSYKLGDVYIMWKVNGNPYIEAITSSPDCKMDTKSVISILTVSQKEYEDPQTTITCAVKHTNMKNTSVPLQVTTSKAKFTLTLKPPIERELFVHDKVVLEAVVSGDVHETVQEASVSCTVKNGPVPIKNIKPGNVFTDTSLFMKIHKVTIDKETWFDGEIVTCTIRDTNNNREIKQEIHFDKGDGQIPTVTIHRPDLYNDSVSLVCEVTSHKLGDVYIMWQVNGNPYIEAITSSPNCKMDTKSVLSILTVSQKEYEDPQTTITCAVKHTNMKNTSVPLQVTTSKAKFTLTLKPPIERELFVHDKVVLEAVVSGDVQETVQAASVSCTVKNEPVSSENIKPGNVFNDTSLFKRIHYVTINTTTWFDGEIVTCTIRDTNNNREIKQEIHFDKGDGQIPTVTIHRPDLYNDSVSLVCEVTSHKLGDVYIMWQVNGNPYIEAKTSSPNCKMDAKSVLSILTVSQKEYEDPKTTITCAVKHANMKNTSVQLQVTTSKAKFTLTLKPPIERELFVHDKVVLEAVVSGDVQETVQEASVSCTVKNGPVPIKNIKPGNVFTDTSLFMKIHNVTIDKETWFDGEIVTCTIRDTNNNREIKQEIHFDKGDGQIPTVTIHRPDLYNDSVSLVCEVTSHKLGDVYIMWKVNGNPYREAITSSPNCKMDTKSVLSILTVSQKEYEDPQTTITCAVKHANMENTSVPLQVTTSKAKFTLMLKPPIERELFVHNKVVLEAVVSGDVQKTVQEASVSCTVKNGPVSSENIKPGNVFKDTSLFKRIHYVTINTTTWFDGEIVTCTIRDTNNNREIKQEIHFDKGDGQIPTVTIHRPDLYNDSVSLVCEVTSHKLGDVYIMWQVNGNPYIEAITSSPDCKMDAKSVLSILTVSQKEYEDPQTTITCAVKHANMKNTSVPLQVTTSKAKFTLTLKPPIERELFVHDKVVLEAVVSGDVQETVQAASVSCTVKNEPVSSENIKPGNVFNDTSLFKRIHYVTINTTTWFDGEIVTCTIRDTNNNREIKQEIHFDKGDGQIPTVTIHRPDLYNDSVSLVCEVTSHKLGDVYIMWQVNGNPYIEAKTSSPNCKMDAKSVLSILTVSQKEYEDPKTTITCAVKHTNMKNTSVPLQVTTSKAKFTLTLKPPIERELFVHDKVVLEAVVSGDVQETVQEASVSCTVKNGPVPIKNIKPGNVFTDTSLFMKIHNVTIDKETWFDGEIVTCTIRDTNNNREIKQEIHFDKGDGQIPTVTIHRPDLYNDSVSLVCEVTSHKLGDVYIMWKVNGNPYREAITSSPNCKMDTKSVLSILTVSQKEYEDPKTTITCAVKHTNMKDTSVPLQVTTSKAKFTLTLKPPIERELFVHNKVVLEAVVSGDVQKTVQEASVSCTVKNEPVSSENIKPGNVFKDTSLFKRIHYVTINTTTWFDGEIVTCTIRDTNNNREIKQEIHFDKGDGQIPTVTIHRPDLYNDSVSLVCEVTSYKLGDVYIMWQVNGKPYREAITSSPNCKMDTKSVISILTVSQKEYEDPQTTITCAVKHANMKDTSVPLQVTTSKAKFTLTLKPPIERELFVHDKVVLEAVVSGDVHETVQEASVSCTVKNEPISSENIKPGNVFKDTSLFKRIHYVTINTTTWFDGEIVTCTIRDTNNNREIKQEIHFDKGDGQIPTVTIHRPDLYNDSVSLVCEVTSYKLGDVYIMWKVNGNPYREAITSSPDCKMDTKSVISILTVSQKEYEDPQTTITCAVKHANMNDTSVPLQVTTSKAKFTLTLKPPIERELFVHDKVVLEAVVSGDVDETVQEASVSCTVKNGPVPIKNIKPGNVFTDTSLFMKIHKVTIDKETWFDGEIVTCTIRDTNNNREIKQEIHFDKGDGQIPTVTIHRPDLYNDSVSLVCEVTSHKLGDVYIMWQVNGNPYIEAITSSPNCKMDAKSVLSILTVSQKEYEDPKTTITCAVKHANMKDTSVPLQVTTSKAKFTLTLKPPIERELFVHDKVVLEAVVSGDVQETVQAASVSCTVKNEPVSSENIKPGNVFNDTSLFKRIHYVTINTTTWFDGEIVTCTIRDTNNNREIKQEIHFDKGDGQIPTVTIHRPDLYNDSVSLVCEVTSHKLGDVYIMWQVNGNPYREAITSSPDCKMDTKSVLSILTVSQKEYEDPQTTITCAVKHTNMKNTSVPLQVTTSKAKFTLTLKPPIERELFVHDKVVLEAVVSGDVQETVQEASVSCTVKNGPVPIKNIKPGNVFTDTSLFMKIHNVTIDKETWFDGEIVTCTIRDTNNNREIKQDIHFDKGDGQIPTVTIHRPDLYNDSVSLVCEVTSHKLGDVYIMWKVNGNPYREAITSSPDCKMDTKSVLSILTVSQKEYEDPKTTITCAVKHANMKDTSVPLQVTTSKTKFTLTLKPPIERELFIHDKVVLEAVVSGDVHETVQEASVSCTVKNGPVPIKNIKPGNVFTDTSLFMKIHNVTINTTTWFDGEIVTCTIRDTNNNREIKQEIHFDKGDGQIPTITIHRPDLYNDSVSLVCEVTSHKLGDVYIMWQVNGNPYIEANTSSPNCKMDTKSVLSILTVSQKEYEDPKTTITCAVKHANMENTSVPLQVTTSKREPPEPEKGFALNCNKDVLEEDEFRSLWSTATSFIFLFLFSLTYSAVLSLFKMKH